ncbi:aminopeptidase N [Litorimonas taeanensis]|uniref:Aminopeptidase N n=1 Tax=Litorimonas taeanensis TaxID=568099 RepID=A0A420WJ26_9PROT|nr:aminopeptidase N [Litorimonas taeanensis]RKQ70925.1 aminopeptidase N [Litorimonas taeanensis]
MKTDTAPKQKQTPTRLADYTPPNFNIEAVSLDFDLNPKETTIRSQLTVTRLAPGPLVLDGEDITLKSVSLDGKTLKRSDYSLTQTQLILKDLPERSLIEIETVCNPSENSTLMGLYVSGGRFCTQCEAEGFRRITYYPDRPDVLSVFRVRLQADLKDYPYLLANGNMVESGALDGGQRHYAIWEDPFPKPAYLFALVAGEFDILEDSFTTMTGRDIPLTIYVDPGDASRAEYAMDSLKRSMKWDEEVFGREYDLDRFMIVAVRDFNFGAMENKGLNIFNSSLLLADAATATDMNFERIESVVAHEYFHNWTGNRITCRDWFQLCLKEGFTVFRDQEFSADQRDRAVQRIKDVKALRMRQFAEDAGPLSHPVRPSEYMKIDNFYTATIYEKGAELIRMLKTMLGEDDFRKGSDVYFERLDGTAATVEQFLESFEIATGRDLSQFMRWYEQAGTPELSVEVESPVNMPVSLTKITFTQKFSPASGQADKQPVIIPIRWQAIGDTGPITEPQLTLLKSKENAVSLPDMGEDFSLSILQDFSAPVILKTRQTSKDHLRLMGQDPNAFKRWEAGQTLARELIGTQAKAIESGQMPKVNKALRGYCQALGKTLDDVNFNSSFKALALTPPAATEIIQASETSDPIAVSLAGEWLSRAIGDTLHEDLLNLYHALSDEGTFSPDAHSAGRRALRNRCLSLLASRQDPVVAGLAIEQLGTATNMTDELAALMTLTKLGGKRVETSMTEFFEKWKNNPLVIDKWFSVQGMRKHDSGIEAIEALVNHSAYDPRNPNRVRSLIGSFAMANPHMFHAVDGSGYAFFTQQVLDMDSRNPQVAARLLGAYEVWRKLDAKRQGLIKAQLRHVIGAAPSKNVMEIANKTLGE